MNREQWTKHAANAIRYYEEAGETYAAAVQHEANLEADRPAAKLAATLRIKSTENPLTEKPHSASSAEAVVETDAEYRAYLSSQSDAVTAKHKALTGMTAFRLRAELAIAVVSSEREVVL